MQHGLDHSIEQCQSWGERLARLRTCTWYWGDLTWKNAERLLHPCEDGTFLIRDSRNEKYLIAVSYKHNNKVFHARIETFFLRFGPLSFTSVVNDIAVITQLIRDGSMHMLMHRRGEEANATEMNLIYPLSRLSVLPRLQYLCRLQIHSMVKPDKIPCLPVPPPILRYLTENKFFSPDVNEAVAILKQRNQELLPHV